ncbi:Acetyl-CoA C-acetyltransferase [Alteripontixanthobacter maritimus]|uniref:Acetyl-CoA C-acetyltransferase n=1 Tax=Alteripontixanthobacter maritimus TaxID=2161824 RepID=A0A369Q8B9_9SPHN|nr:acetyl-CoA C-acetyltransferase [Alteripontixanthobacter maritimus]RDC59169.1 Acetyl-CoA C-acetyltransferase [Alteripontixanthobacter maritimus]
MAEAYIIDAVRTPRAVGKPGKGAYSGVHPQHLAKAVLAAIRDRNDLDTKDVDDIIWGTSSQVGEQAGDLGRMAALDAGYDITASGVTLDRYCGSGITATALAAAQVMSGMEDLVIAGGTESMSKVAEFHGGAQQAGFKMPFGIGAGNETLDAVHPQTNQGVAADAIAAMEGIDRKALEELGATSQQRAGRAIEEGRFDKSLVTVKNADGEILLDREEYPRPETTVETLGEMKPAFGKFYDYPIAADGTTFAGQIKKKYPDLEFEPVHHVGTSSGVVDGAAAILLASKEYADAHGLKPRARIVATANVGDDPTLMLNAPVPAAKKVLAKAGLTKDDIDVWEINEAFAVVAEKFIRDLDLDRAKVNINGGSIALGHPIGATGAILIGTALDELERSEGRYALITMCAAGGMAPAIIIERV